VSADSLTCSFAQVEMEIIMPIDYTLKQVHDISLELQIKARALKF